LFHTKTRTINGKLFFGSCAFAGLLPRADLVPLVVLKTRLVTKDFAAHPAPPLGVLRVSQLVSLLGGQLEKSLVAKLAVVLLLLKVYFADMSVQSGKLKEMYRTGNA
jgi:hypothetical protein